MILTCQMIEFVNCSNNLVSFPFPYLWTMYLLKFSWIDQANRKFSSFLSFWRLKMKEHTWKMNWINKASESTPPLQWQLYCCVMHRPRSLPIWSVLVIQCFLSVATKLCRHHHSQLGTFSLSLSFSHLHLKKSCSQ